MDIHSAGSDLYFGSVSRNPNLRVVGLNRKGVSHVKTCVAGMRASESSSTKRLRYRAMMIDLTPQTRIPRLDNTTPTSLYRHSSLVVEVC